MHLAHMQPHCVHAMAGTMLSSTVLLLGSLLIVYMLEQEAEPGFTRTWGVGARSLCHLT